MDISESDIEQVIFDEDLLQSHAIEVIARQYRTEYGVIDIIGYAPDDSAIVVIEIKKGVIDENAIAQILRYMCCIKELLVYCRDKPSDIAPEILKRVSSVRGMLIGSGSTEAARLITRIMTQISLLKYTARLDVGIRDDDWARNEDSVRKDLDRANDQLVGGIESAIEQYEEFIEWDKKRTAEQQEGQNTEQEGPS